MRLFFDPLGNLTPLQADNRFESGGRRLDCYQARSKPPKGVFFRERLPEGRARPRSSSSSSPPHQ
jgi:hypothetical protein